jgi:hypothetical protein
MTSGRRNLIVPLIFLAGVFAPPDPTLGADLYTGAPKHELAQPFPSPNQWRFSFTPYAWATGVNGSVTARGHKVNIDESFIDIVEDSDSLFALMGFFEARKGRFSLFTDVVWEDLGFPGHYQRSGSPFRRLPNVNISVRANAQLDYEQLIIQSGIAYEVARWQGTASAYTALDLMGSARYWNEETDINLKISGVLTADLERLGLQVQRSRSRVIAKSGTLEWVDPVIGMRLRHQMASGSELALLGDIGGFGAGSEFSWQVVGTYGFDVMCFGTPLRTVLGYRALAVEYSEDGRFGKNALDVVQHGPVMGVSLRW